MPRQLIRIKRLDFEGFGCSECGWLFNYSGEPVGRSLEEMKKVFAEQRDKEFAAHRCTNRSKTTQPK